MIKHFIFPLLLLVSIKAEAHFEFSPISISLTTTGKSSHSIAQVINRSNEAVPIIVKVTQRKLLENGQEDRPDTSEVTAFPNQFLLSPKETKTIKISWQGEEKIATEQAYRIIVEEVPIVFTAKNQDRGAVRIMINYVGSIYVNSDATEPNLKLEKVESLSEDKKKLSLLFSNDGSAHAILKSPSIELIAKSVGNLAEKKITLDKTQLVLVEGKNVLAKSKLRINIVRPQDLQGYDSFEWKFSYDK
ncbi:MAG: molecular chaperone [Rhizobacter sp.]|nr:molecular chaperone [Bacteriovorax sp.]